MPLTRELQELVEQRVRSGSSLAAVGFGMCWPTSSKIASDINISLRSGENIHHAADRLDLLWNPTWLLDAGFAASDIGGRALGPDDPASAPGPITWTPKPNLPRLDDQTPDSATGFSRARRLAAEVAVTALWADNASLHDAGGSDPRPVDDLSGNTRGARFKDFLVHILGKELPDGWTVLPEVPLTSIRGLHMRKDVGQRKSDIAVLDDANRLVAVSIEDSAYHLVPTLAGAYRRIYEAYSGGRFVTALRSTGGVSENG